MVQASATQTPISSVIQVNTGTGHPCAPVAGTVASGPRAPLRNRLAILAAMLGAVLAALLRRRPRAMKGAAVASLTLALLAGSAREARADEYQNRVGRAALLAADDQHREALAELEAAYALRQSPALLFDIARAHQHLGDTRAALDGYERFLTAAGAGADSAKRAEAEAELVRLRPRYERKPSRGLMAGGAVLFGAGYVGAVVTGSHRPQRREQRLLGLHHREPADRVHVHEREPPDRERPPARPGCRAAPRLARLPR